MHPSDVKRAVLESYLDQLMMKIVRVTMGEAIIAFSQPLEDHVTPDVNKVIAAVKGTVPVGMLMRLSAARG